MSETATLIQVLEDGRTIYYVAVASLALLVFDHVLTIQEEVELIWKSRWNFSKILYLWQRYFALVSLSGLTAARLHGFCGGGIFYRFEGIIITIIIALVDSVLAVRVWVLYARSKRVLWFLITMITLEAISMLILDGITVTAGVKDDFILHVPSITVCVTPAIPLRFISYYPLVPLVTTSIMIFMTVFRCVRTLSELRGYRSGNMPILSLFLRDGIFWFLAVLFVTFAAFLSWHLGHASLGVLMNSPMIVVYTIISSRTLLNLKEVLSMPAPMTQASQLEMASRATFRGTDSWV